MTGLNFTIVKKFKKTADLLIFSFYFVFGLFFFLNQVSKRKHNYLTPPFFSKNSLIISILLKSTDLKTPVWIPEVKYFHTKQFCNERSLTPIKFSTKDETFSIE